MAGLREANLARAKAAEHSERIVGEAEHLRLLRHQLDPHFLFNSLASIAGSLPDGATLSRDMMNQLGEFCRLSLSRPDNGECFTLAEELALLRSFLAVELMRWGGLLEVEIFCPPELAEARIPALLLLPLVENALKYGRATSEDRVGLRLAVRDEAGALLIEVANTGRWVAPSEARTVPSLEVGLANVRARLRGHFPRAHELTCGSADGWVTVALRLFPLGDASPPQAASA